MRRRRVDAASVAASSTRPRLLSFQLIRDFRKPLIVSEPKGLFRHKLAVSPIEDFGPGE